MMAGRGEERVSGADNCANIYFVFEISLLGKKESSTLTTKVSETSKNRSSLQKYLFLYPTKIFKWSFLIILVVNQARVIYSN